MRTALLLLLAVAVLAASLAPPSPTALAQQPASLTAERVQNSIRQGIDYLLNEQSARGTWDEMTEYPGGVTGLCTLALLTAGVKPNDPKVQKSLDYLRGLKSEKTYSVALQTMALAAGEPLRDLPLIQANVQWLERTQIKAGDRSGSWSYGDAAVMAGDNSNTQFAVLALHEAERVGAKVDPQVWQLSADYYRRMQNPDGSWGYLPKYPGSGSMTSAGIGAWVICQQRVADPAARVENGVAQCCLPPTPDDVLERAVVWMGRNFSVHRNPGAGSGGNLWHLYYLYAMERVGRLTARRFLGDHDWYREGAEMLIGMQDPFSHQLAGRRHCRRQHRTLPPRSPCCSCPRAAARSSSPSSATVLATTGTTTPTTWPTSPSCAEHQWGLDLTWQVIDPEPADSRGPAAIARAIPHRQQDPGATRPRPQDARLHRPRRLSLRRSLLRRRQPVRRRHPPVPRPRLSRGRVQAPPHRPGAPHLAHRPRRAARLALCRPPVDRRVRLPHVRGVFRSRPLLLLGAELARPRRHAARAGPASASTTP